MAFSTDALPFDAIVADDPPRRRLGWSNARVSAAAHGALPALFFSFDVEGLHAFWMRDVAFDLDLVFLDDDGVVLAVHTLTAGSTDLVLPPEPIRYALELPAGGARRHRVAPLVRLAFSPADVAPVIPPHTPEVPVEPDARDDPALILRWSEREHAYSSRRFAAAMSLLGWPLRVGPDDVAIWLHGDGGLVLHPRVCPLGPLQALTRSLGLAWLRLELAPHVRLRLPDGRLVTERFDPRAPDLWLARMRAYDLLPTDGRWQHARTLLVDLSGDEAAAFARLPTRIRYEARAFSRSLEAGHYRVEAVAGAAFDARQERAFSELHDAWLAAHPGAEDNMRFCRPVAHGYQDALTAYLCWRGTDLLAVQLHILWDSTLYYLFSETVPGAPQGLTPGLLWHGVCHALAAPFGPSPAPDLLDLVGAYDARYPRFRAFGRGYTAAKLRWHPTSLYFPPAVAFAGTELPP